MRGAFRFVTTVTGLFLIGLAVVGLLLMGPFSHFVAGLVARDLTNVYGAQVTLADMKLRPFQQRIELQGLTINNPESFRTGPAVVVERVDIDLNTPAFLSGAPAAKRVLFAGMTVHLRHEGAQGTNLGKLVANARAYAAELREQAPSDTEPRGMRVEILQVEDTILRLSSDVVQAIELSRQIDDFEVDNIAERGALVRGEIGQMMLQAVLLEATGISGISGTLSRILRGEAAESTPGG